MRSKNTVSQHSDLLHHESNISLAFVLRASVMAKA